jgi:hypothetical protein
MEAKNPWYAGPDRVSAATGFLFFDIECVSISGPRITNRKGFRGSVRAVGCGHAELGFMDGGGFSNRANSDSIHEFERLFEAHELVCKGLGIRAISPLALLSEQGFRTQHLSILSAWFGGFSKSGFDPMTR